MSRRDRARPTLAGRWPAEKVDGRAGHQGRASPPPANGVTWNANLRRTRDLLLPKLVSGEIDVSNLDTRM
jgi:hypothetical protein